MFLLSNQLTRGAKRNEAYNKGSGVSSSVNWPTTSFILFQIGFAWLEITFSPG